MLLDKMAFVPGQALRLAGAAPALQFLAKADACTASPALYFLSASENPRD